MEFVDPPDLPTMNVLLYGPPKTGKSSGASTVPGDVLFLNADLPNATRFVHRRNPGGRVHEVRIPEATSAKPQPLFDLMQEIVVTLSHPGHSYGAVVVDPIGELHRRLLEEFSRRAVRPSLPTYGDVTVHLERFCRKLCELPITTVLVCHDHPVKDESIGEVERLPFTGTSNPTLGQKLLGMVDVIGYTGTVQTEDGTTNYVAQLVALKGRRGGDRFDCLGDLRAVDIGEWLDTVKAHEDHIAQAMPAAKPQVASDPEAPSPIKFRTPAAKSTAAK